MVSRRSTQKPFLYLFTGDEFLRHHKIESLIQDLLSSKEPGKESLRLTNLYRLYPPEIVWSELIRQASTPSLMAAPEIFWISQAELFKKTDFSLFETYCANPVLGVYFVFEADELSSTHPLLKLVERFGEHVQLSGSSKEAGMELFQGKLTRFGKTIDSEAWQVLMERLGASSRLIDLAIDQLILYTDGPTIDLAAAEKLSSEFLRFEPFELTDALARKDVSKMIQMVRYFHELTGDLTSTVGLIHWQLKRIWQAKRILGTGGGQKEIASTLRVPPFRLSAFMNQVRAFDLSDVEDLLGKLWQLDWNTKRGLDDDQIAVETFLAGVLCSVG